MSSGIFEWTLCTDDDEFEIEVEWEHDDGEYAVMYPNDKAYPGSLTEVTSFRALDFLKAR